jgi:hypothetical protein
MKKASNTNMHATLAWSRVTTWWKYPHENWERERIETLDDDLSPAAKGYEIIEVAERACLQDRNWTYFIDVHDSTCLNQDDELAGHEHWFNIARTTMSEEPDEDLAQEDGFDSFNEAKRQAESRLAALLLAGDDMTRELGDLQGEPAVAGA